MRILWIKTELLHPVDKGGKIRTFHMLKELKRAHHVTYLTLDDGSGADDAGERADEYCHRLIRVPHLTRPKFSARFYVELAANLLSPMPYFMTKYQSGPMRRAIAQMSGQRIFDVLVCDFLQPSVNVPAKMPEPAVLFQHNVEAMIWRRHYELQTHPVKRSYLYGQWRKSLAYERAACRRFNRVVAVSREDAEKMEHDYGIERVSHVPTGVDVDYFRPAGAVSADPFSLVFTGSMDWLPNEDAMQWFTRDIFPLVKQAVPQVTLTVVGRNPYASLVELGRRDSSIVVTGRVDDVRPYIERAAVCIVPIRVGGGTRLKIFEAMAMEKALVSTAIGAEGLPVRDGEHLLIAESPRAFADGILRLLRDEPAARQLGAAAACLVRRDFGWPRVAEAFARVCEDTIAHPA